MYLSPHQIPLAWLYNKIQISFRKTNTAIARLEAISRSPIYAYFSETLNGVRAQMYKDIYVNKTHLTSCCR